MDTKIIKQYGEDILCYRLRSARQKKRMQYKDFEKRLVQLDREEKELYRRRKNLGWVPLVPPVQKGWKRFFVLRDDVAKSKDADFFRGILDRINTYDWSHRKNFLVRRRRQGKKVYAVKSQKLKEPWPEEFAKMGFGEKELKYFDVERRLSHRGHYHVVFVFNQPWRFVLKVRPNMITKTRERDEVLEARLKAIGNFLVRNDWKWTQMRLMYGSCKWRHFEDKIKHDEEYLFKNWPLERILDRVKEEKIKR